MGVFVFATTLVADRPAAVARHFRSGAALGGVLDGPSPPWLLIFTVFSC
jgi:hypothetical protein